MRNFAAFAGTGDVPQLLSNIKSHWIIVILRETIKFLFKSHWYVKEYLIFILIIIY